MSIQNYILFDMNVGQLCGSSMSLRSTCERDTSEVQFCLISSIFSRTITVKRRSIWKISNMFSIWHKFENYLRVKIFHWKKIDILLVSLLVSLYFISYIFHFTYSASLYSRSKVNCKLCNMLAWTSNLLECTITY